MRNIKRLFVLTSVLWLLTSGARGQETVPQSQAVLKSYFVTGAVPTQNDFAEWIDTMFWYINATYTNALAAQQAAAAAANGPIKANMTAVVAPNGTSFTSILTTNNISTNSIGFYQSYYAVTVWFSTPFPDTNYFPYFKAAYPVPSKFLLSNPVGNVLWQSTTNCIVCVWSASWGAPGQNLPFNIFFVR